MKHVLIISGLWALSCGIAVSQQTYRYAFNENSAGYKVFVHGVDSIAFGNKRPVKSMTDEVEIMRGNERYHMQFIKGIPLNIIKDNTVIASFPTDKVLLKNKVYIIEKTDGKWKYLLDNKLVLTCEFKKSAKEMIIESLGPDAPGFDMLLVAAMANSLGIDNIRSRISRRARYDSELRDTVYQPVFTSVELRDHSIRNLQALPLGDSVFLSLREDQSTFRQLFILPDGSQKKLSIPELWDKSLIAITDASDRLLFYYPQAEKRVTMLHALAVDKNTGAVTKLQQPITLPGEMIGSYVDRDLFLVFVEKKQGTIRLMQIRDLVIVNERSFAAPQEIFDDNISSIAFIREGAPVKPIQADADGKIYLTETDLVITTEHRSTATIPKDLFRGTIVSRTDLRSGKSSTVQIPEKSLKKFNTFWHQGYLYKVVSHKGSSISIYDDDKIIKTFVLQEHEPYSDEAAYLRDAVAKRVFDNRSVWDAIDNTGSPFLSVQGQDTLIMRTGTHKLVKQGAPVPMLTNLGLGIAVATLFAKLVTMSLDDGLSVDHYFYLRGNVNEGFTYTNNTGLAEQRIDLYEIYDPKKDIEYKEKAYLATRNFIAAFYIVRGEKKLMMLKFASQKE